jgi:predicted enzyme related to lactoylglutathione lyase
MSEKTSHTPGTFCWIDLGTPDQDAAGDFYGALFGWRLKEDENAEQTGGYRTAELEGKAVGGVMKLMQEGQPPAWLNYVCVEDADATVARARQAGAAVHAEPMSVLDYGRMAILADPTGAAFGVWQPGVHKGADIVGEPGAMSWSELNTRDPEAAKSFYGNVFGWSFEEKEYDRGAYSIISINGEGIGGVTDRLPAEAPAHWLVYFAVEDADATLKQAEERGAEIPTGPFDIAEVGRIAVVKDPWGALFAVIQPDPSMQPG